MTLSFLLLGIAQLVGLTCATIIPRLLNSDISSGCSTDGSASCQSTSAPSNTCCTEYPSGLLLQTQFWDTNVAGSPADSWTIHGLWNDNCDGTYQESCDPSRNYDISQLLTDQGATSTLDYMKQYWLNDAGTSEQLWNHEWITHGTCFSTLEPSCLPSGSPQGAEAVAYCETIVQLFQNLPTYTWLANAEITPSTTQTYALSDILSALQNGSGGYTPALGCKSGGLNTISWYFNLKGSVIDGTFVPINAPSSGNSCPSNGVRYLPKNLVYGIEVTVGESLNHYESVECIFLNMSPPINHPCLHLDVLHQTFSIEKYASADEIPSDALRELSTPKMTPGILSITRTAEEISIVCEAKKGEGEWRCIKIVGPMEFELTGVICAFATPLKNVGIPMFAISTWNTDYVLVPEGRIMDAVYALNADGWLFVEGSSIRPCNDGQ